MMGEASISGFVVDSFEGVNDHFTSLEVLGTHGHNVLARAKRFGRWYLLKGLAPEVADQHAYHEMLVKEFDIMMRLQHPGVVQAMTLEDVDGLGKCIVMEWVEGITLSDWLADKPTRAERRKVAQQLMDALAHVHQHGVVHRDIKPSNIMVTTNGQNVKIIDFGLADTNVHAVLKQPAGTARYMAPEQASASKPDLRNDIYSLGLVLRDLKLGRKYDKAIARCLAPIDSRMQSVEELKSYLKRGENRRRNALWGVVGIAGALLVGVILWQQLAIKDVNAQNRALSDSIRMQMHENTRLTEQRIDSSSASTQTHLRAMNDSLQQLRQVNNQLQEREQQRMERQHAVDAAIEEGTRIARDTNLKTHIAQHLDTVTSKSNVWIEGIKLIEEGRTEAKKYLTTVAASGKFNSKEMAEIEYAIMEYCNDYERIMKGKYHHAVYSLP